MKYPKPERKKLTPAQRKKLRIALYDVYEEHCPECGLWREFEQMHIHHIKTRGAGGLDDRLKNLDWICFECHREGP